MSDLIPAVIDLLKNLREEGHTLETAITFLEKQLNDNDSTYSDTTT